MFTFIMTLLIPFTSFFGVACIFDSIVGDCIKIKTNYYLAGGCTLALLILNMIA